MDVFLLPNTVYSKNISHAVEPIRWFLSELEPITWFLSCTKIAHNQYNQPIKWGEMQWKWKVGTV